MARLELERPRPITSLPKRSPTPPSTRRPAGQAYHQAGRRHAGRPDPLSVRGCPARTMSV